MAQVFLSPGVYTKEQDFSAYASTIGITQLGLVGLTQKGPAFQVTPISTSDQFAATFGGTDVNLALPYVANSFLTQSNQLNVVRVLGANGFTNSNSWTVTSSSGYISSFVPGTGATQLISFSAVQVDSIITVSYGSTILGAYTASTTSLTSNGISLAQVINSGGTGFSAAFVSAGTISVTSPLSSGATINGTSLQVSVQPATYVSGNTFTGGVNVVNSTLGIQLVSASSGCTVQLAVLPQGASQWTIIGSYTTSSTATTTNATNQVIAINSGGTGFSAAYISGSTYVIHSPSGSGALYNNAYFALLTSLSFSWNGTYFSGGVNEVRAAEQVTIVNAQTGSTISILSGITTIGSYKVSTTAVTSNAYYNLVQAINSGGTGFSAVYNSGSTVNIFAPVGLGTSASAITLTILPNTTNSQTSISPVDVFGGSINISTTYGYNGIPLCTLRSKLNPTLEAFQYVNQSDIVMVPQSTSGNPLSEFMISGVSSSLSANPISVSLDETQAHYIINVIGNSPMRQDSANEYGLYVEAIYPHYLRQFSNQLTGLGYISGLTSDFYYSSSINTTNYTGGYTNSITPWVVSNKIGNNVLNLFRFQTIADGNSSAADIKISIVNIDPVNYVFDVLVRNFNDTDATAIQNAVERFIGCSLDPTVPNYIASQIGTTDGEYPQKSNYITLDLISGIPTNVVPAGFGGYSLPTLDSGYTQVPQMVYKTSYSSVDNINKAYLGLTELAYTQLESKYQNSVNIFNSVNTLESDLFKFRGAEPVAVTSLGFHMEDLSNTSLSGTYSTPTNGITITGYTKTQAKFTLVPAGGFDGWEPFWTPTFNDVDANNPSQTDYYNVQQLQQGIALFAAPEQVAMNLFATPGIDYANNANSVRYALSMIEDRADTLYIIDSPRDSQEDAILVSNDLQNSGIDSSYAATYWPWVQILDQSSNKYVYVAPTMQVVQAIALTDNSSYPWFAPAGFTRGSINVVRAEERLSKTDRDTLYSGRINPIATFTQQGVVIFGQKTLQVAQTALNRVNVRRLLIQIETLIAASSQVLLFEQDDTTLQDQFKAKVEPLLQSIQNNRGLYAFNIVMDASNNTNATLDQNELVGKIQIQPTKTAEFINLTFQVLPTGANFSAF